MDGLYFVGGQEDTQFNPFHSGYLQTGLFVDSRDPDEMPHYVAFHLGMHCLQR